MKGPSVALDRQAEGALRISLNHDERNLLGAFVVHDWEVACKQCGDVLRKTFQGDALLCRDCANRHLLRGLLQVIDDLRMAAWLVKHPEFVDQENKEEATASESPAPPTLAEVVPVEVQVPFPPLPPPPVETDLQRAIREAREHGNRHAWKPKLKKQCPNCGLVNEGELKDCTRCCLPLDRKTVTAAEASAVIPHDLFADAPTFSSGDMSRDLERRADDPHVPEASFHKAASQSPFEPCIVRTTTGLNVAGMTPEEQAWFAGHKEGTFSFFNASDVYRYEAAAGDPEVYAALQEGLRGEGAEDYGEKDLAFYEKVEAARAEVRAARAGREVIRDSTTGTASLRDHRGTAAPKPKSEDDMFFA